MLARHPLLAVWNAQKWVEYCCVVTYAGAAYFYANEKAFLDSLPPLASINGADVRSIACVG